MPQRLKLKTVLASLALGFFAIGFGTIQGAAMAEGEGATAKQITPRESADELMSARADVPVDTSNWTAFENRMPPRFPTLYVEGQVSLPNPGYNAELVRPFEQNIADNALTLVVRVDPPSGRFVYPQVITPVTVRYEDEFYLGNYEQVVIRAEDGSVLETIMISVVQ